jgi:hypothetical protein
MPETVNYRKMLRGFEGELWMNPLANTDNDFDPTSRSKRLGNVNTWRGWLTVNNLTYQPSGQGLELATHGSYSAHLTLVELIMDDGDILKRFLDELKLDRVPSLDFFGVIAPKKRQAQNRHVAFNDCILDGDMEFGNVDPGSLLQANWTLRCNSIPDLLQMLAV